MLIDRDSPWINEVTPYFEKLERVFYANGIFLGFGIATCILIPFPLLKLASFLIIVGLMLYSPRLSRLIFKKSVAKHEEEVAILCESIPPDTSAEERLKILEIFDPSIPKLQMLAVKVLFISLLIGLIVIASGLISSLLNVLINADLIQANSKLFLQDRIFSLTILISAPLVILSVTILMWHFLCKPSLFPIAPSAILNDEDLTTWGKVRRFIWSTLGVLVFMCGMAISFLVLHEIINHNIDRHMLRLIGNIRSTSVTHLVQYWLQSYLVFTFLGGGLSFSCVAKVFFDYFQLIFFKNKNLY